jgi:hypothetical protein
MRRVPLHLHLLAHPGSSSAGLLTQELMRRFVEPPSSGGLRLPIRFTPDRGDGLPPEWDRDDGINLDAAEHTLVVVLVDARMARHVTFQGVAGTGARWAEFLAEGARRAPVGSSAHHVFGVAIAKPRDGRDTVEDACFTLGGPRHMLGVTKEPSSRIPGESLEAYAARLEPWLGVTADEVALHITIRAIHLLEKGKVPADVSPDQKAPVRFFLSHAKADLGSSEADPVRKVEDEIKELPIEPWFDAAEIVPGEEFGGAIESGIASSSIILSFVTDSYSSRPWCKREVLEAKKKGVPIVVVDALSSGETRNFPYLGNVPTVHWTGKDPKGETQQIVSRAVREALRFKYNLALLKNRAEAGEIVLASPPEAVMLAWKPAGPSQTEVYFYPDPPLTAPELAVLKNLRPGADFITPFTRVARKGCPPGIKAIAVSTSVSNDKERFGLARSHEEAIFDEIHAYLLMAGLQIAYGGALQIISPSNGTNFTQRLFELVRAYSRLAPGAGAKPLKPILNLAPWPLRLSYGEEEINRFGTTAEIVEGDRPPESEVPEPDHELFPPGKPVAAHDDTVERRLAWARGLTEMRLRMTRETQARIVIGGTLSGFKGLIPGIVEEAWLSLVHRQPLFLVGGFGGATRAVIDLLQGQDRPELDTKGLAASVPFFHEVVELAKHRGVELLVPQPGAESDPSTLAGKLAMPDRLVADFRTMGAADLSRTLNNGLSKDENEELFRSVDPWRIAELVLAGLSKLN